MPDYEHKNQVAQAWIALAKNEKYLKQLSSLIWEQLRKNARLQSEIKAYWHKNFTMEDSPKGEYVPGVRGSTNAGRNRNNCPRMFIGYYIDNRIVDYRPEGAY